MSCTTRRVRALDPAAGGCAVGAALDPEVTQRWVGELHHEAFARTGLHCTKTQVGVRAAPRGRCTH